MGIDIAHDLAYQNHVCPEQRLWRHVLIHAFEEARLITSDRKSSILKMEAHEWIIQDDSDFQKICWWSGWEPEHVRSQYFKAVRNGEITFNSRQVKWAEYYKKYLKLKTALGKDNRRYLKTHVDRARWAVFHATTALVSNFIINAQVS